jgi:predicted small lipoprotein YifL
LLVPFPLARRSALIVVVLAALSGCGRRGDLEAPNANAVQPTNDKHDLQVHRPSQKITPPKKDFVLDPLLQ